MGNSLCQCPGFQEKLQLPNLQRLSTYGQHSSKLDKNMLKTMVQSSNGQYKKNMVKKKLETSQTKQFSDDKFILDSIEQTRLSQLFNFKKSKIKIYQQTITEHSNFIQLNAEFTYITAVFYFYCDKSIKKQFFQTLFKTKQVSHEGYYILNFYCNGANHQIVIDDNIPTNRQSLMYLRILSGLEVWPMLMEKTWCKQIGSYKKALGLSPEDAFEQITGIPTYSYKIANNKSFIKNLLQESYKQKQWVCLVARQGLQDLVSRQVFYLKSIQGGYYTIISAYSKFMLEQSTPKKRGEVRIREESLFNHFEFVVVGHYKKGFKNNCLPIKCKSHEQMIFKFQVTEKQDISIRFNQFYQGYISQDYKQKYKYSPVLIEVYEVITDLQGNQIVVVHQKGQGCKRALSGARSVYCSKDIFSSFNAGIYFIRMQVQWAHESYLNEGNLNIYSLNGRIQPHQIQNNNQFLFLIYPVLIKSKLKSQEDAEHEEKRASKGQIEKRSIQEHLLDIITYYKKNTTLIMFHSNHEIQQKFQINFQKSKNIVIRGGNVRGKKTLLTIKGRSNIVIQILAEKILQESIIESFQITKIQQKN